MAPTELRLMAEGPQCEAAAGRSLRGRLPPARPGNLLAGSVAACVVGQRTVRDASGLDPSASMRYGRKTRRFCANRDRRLVIGVDYRCQRGNALHLSSPKSISVATVRRPLAWTGISVRRGVIGARLTKSSIVRRGSIRAESTVCPSGGRGCFAHHRAET